jgi:DedD protein
MDSRAKQRLTGAVILVALFVLLVPELLTGPKESVAPTRPDEEGLRRYTIDLDAPASGVGQDVANQPAVTLPPVVETPMAASPEQPAQPGESAAPEQPQAVLPVPTQAQPKPATSASSAAVTSPAPAPAVAPPTPRVEPARPPAAGSQPRSFVVQLGSFSNKANAEKLVRDMTARGFATFIAPITTNGRELYRVRVGPTRDRPAAEALAAQLKRAGQSGSIVPIP